MALKPGTLLGPYEVLSLIGAGGMGEVYKGRDPRLDRIVALKVLAPHLVDHPEARQRLEREAKTLANLQHAHICTLYDVGHQVLPRPDSEGQDDIHYLVMEYLEGETVAQRLQKGPLSLDHVLRYATELADALNKAHRFGATHRDIKPGNIMLTKDGSKLLDFGLAKLKQEFVRATIPASELPTAPGALTQHGTLLGTLQYMAPEQIEGKVDELDARTDVFAFGAVVFEMVTGKKAFDGQTQASVIAKVLEHDPPAMSSLQPLTPPALDRVVKTCLAKDPDERWQTARDLWRELTWIRESVSSSRPEAAPVKTSGVEPAPAEVVEPAKPPAPEAIPAPVAKGLRRTLPVSRAGLIAVVLAIATGIAVWTLKPSPAPVLPVTRTVINLPPGDRLPPAEQRALALSPDGKLLAYVAIHNVVQQLYLRPMDGFEAKAVPGTEGAAAPFFSPDSQWLGFFAGGKLKKVSVSGGAAVTIGDAPGITIGMGASWSGNDTIAFQSSAAGGLLQVPAAGGGAQRLTTPGKGDFIHRWPEFLSGGAAVLFTASSNNVNWISTRIAAYLPGTGQQRELLQTGVSPRYAPPGSLIYAQGGTLMAAPFDAKRLEVTGVAVPVIEGVSQSLYSGNAQYAFSAATGTLVYVPGLAQGSQSKLVWVSRNGTEQPLPAPARSYSYHRISPDGKRVAMSVAEQELQVWTYDLARETLTRLTFEGSVNLVPAWTPDGKRIAFNSDRAGPFNLYWQLADGSGGIERLTTSEYLHAPASLSPDSQLLAYLEIHPTTGFDLWVLRLSDHKAQPFLRTQFNESSPKFSPDGHWLAYVSDESGRWEVYVQPYPGPGGKWQISTEGGTEPVWNPNGRELFYRSGDKMMAVDVEVGQASTPVSSGQAGVPSTFRGAGVETGRPVATGFSAGKPRVLFDAGQYLPTPVTFPNYDVSPDGQRFLMLKPSEQQGQAATQINVVLNWFEELRRKVPVK